jgi:hypothetical protein
VYGIAGGITLEDSRVQQIKNLCLWRRDEISAKMQAQRDKMCCIEHIELDCLQTESNLMM